VAGGYSPARRLLVALADGRTVFVKVATLPFTQEGLLVEGRLYDALAGRPFAPARLAFDAEVPAVLVLEDLSRAHWPPPWRPGDVAAAMRALDGVHGTPPPEGLRRLADDADLLSTWAAVAKDPAPFLSLGLAGERWLDRALPTLLEAQRTAPVGGDALCHQDVRSDNWAFADGRAVLVDWNWAAVGNPDLDAAFWCPSLEAEGGPRCADAFRGDARLAAVVSGWFAASAGLPPPPGGPRVRAVQRTQLTTALPWVCEALGLPRPGP
jgi:hypothetical protein